MMLGREVRLPEHLMYGPAASNTTSRKRYAAELADRMEEAHDKLLRATATAKNGRPPRRAFLQSWAAGMAKDEAVFERPKSQATAKIHGTICG